jgi:hypothetical protein
VLGNKSRRLAALAAATATVCAAPAAAYALGPAIGPNQYFTGSLIDASSTGVSTTTNTLLVACASTGLGATGHPLPGQALEVNLIVPSTSATAGFTGTLANSIDASVIWSLAEPPITVDEPIGTFTAYSTPLAVSTDLTVPCSGTGVLSFAPDPTSKSAVNATVNITFVSNIATG